MRKLLEKIETRLETMYPDRNPMIEIFGDGSWMVEVDNDKGRGRIGGELSGESIDELEEQLHITL